jgi:hypothetical protein
LALTLTNQLLRITPPTRLEYLWEVCLAEFPFVVIP